MWHLYFKLCVCGFFFFFFFDLCYRLLQVSAPRHHQCLLLYSENLPAREVVQRKTLGNPARRPGAFSSSTPLPIFTTDCWPSLLPPCGGTGHSRWECQGKVQWDVFKYKSEVWVGEIAQWLSALAALLWVLSSIPTNPMVPHTHPEWDLVPSSGLACRHTCSLDIYL